MRLCWLFLLKRVSFCVVIQQCANVWSNTLFLYILLLFRLLFYFFHFFSKMVLNGTSPGFLWTLKMVRYKD